MAKIRKDFVKLLRYHGLTVENWIKFKKLFFEKDIEDKCFYDDFLIKITNIRTKYRNKDIVISEIEELFVHGIKKIEITGSYKNKNSKGLKHGI